MRFQGKIALVTGAGRGIGKATALCLAKEGAHIVVNDINVNDAITTGGEIEALGCETLISNANVVVRIEAEQMFKRIEERFGGLDILVNNAGITRDNMFLKMGIDQWDQVMDVNLKGVFHCSQLAAGIMSKQNSGKIVNLSSIAGQMGNVGQCNYATSKAGVMGFTKNLANELARYSINVNAVAPGYIETPMTEAIPDKVKDVLKSKIPLGRAGLPEDVAKLVAFLVSEDSSYITGQIIACNGGWYL